MLHVADVASFPTTENATTSRPFPHRVEQAFGLPIESGSTIAAFEARMRTTFDNKGAGSWAQPANPPRLRRLASWAAIFVLSVMALSLGTLAAAEYEALTDMDARGEVDPTW